MRLPRFLLDLALLTLLSYPILYFSYKYYTPVINGADYKFYYETYLHPLDLTATKAPFVYRQGSALLAHLIYRLGLFYQTNISYEDPARNVRVFFAALLANYVALVLAAGVVAAALRRRLPGPGVLPLLGGLCLFLAWQCSNFVVTGLTEGVSWLLMAMLWALYDEGRRWRLFVLLMLLSAFQREMIAIAFLLVAAAAMLGRRRVGRAEAVVLLSAAASFALHLLVRGVAFPVAGHEHQLSPGGLLGGLAHFPADRAFLFQVVLSENLLWLALALALLLRRAGRREEPALWHLVAAFAGMAVVGVAAGVYNNMGRVEGLLVPPLACQIGLMLARLEGRAAGRAA